MLDVGVIERYSPKGEVGPFDELEQALGRRLGVINQMHGRINCLFQVVRGDIGRHTDRNTKSAVQEEIRRGCREDIRLLPSRIVVGAPRDSLLLQILEELVSEPAHLGLGVAHRRRRIAVDRAEIALPQNQGVAVRKFLRHLGHRVVDGGIAVRVVLAEDFTDHSCTFAKFRARHEAHITHRVEDAAVDGLQTVSHIRQGARRDDRHRVVEIRDAHLGDD